MSSHGGNVLAFDVGGTQLRSALVAPDGRLLSRHSRQTPAGGFQPLLAELAAAGRTVLDEAPSLPGGAPQAIGLALAGYTETASGRVLYSTGLGLRDAPLGTALAAQLKLPVRLVNDVNAAALAEARSAGVDDLVAVFVGTGVGTGFVCSGTLVEGRRGMAAEGGHACFREGGELCRCGQRGCYEAYLGGAALAERASAAYLPMGPDGGASALFDLARRGDPRAKPLAAEACAALASLCRLLVTLFDPALIVLAGGVASATPELLEAARRAVDPHPLVASAGAVPVAAARHGDEAGLRGAALLASPLASRESHAAAERRPPGRS
ncbi:MAG: ROK family protein [Planctomycetota bacterium]